MKGKNSRLEITAPGYNTEIRRDALKRVERTAPHYPRYCSCKPEQCSMESYDPHGGRRVK